MHVPRAITFEGLERSDSLEAAAERWVDRLEPPNGSVVGCRVVIAQPANQRRARHCFSVRVMVELPDAPIATAHAEHEDAYVAVADAFRAARRHVMAYSAARSPRARRRVATGTTGPVLKG